jgi:hypothetical protein
LRRDISLRLRLTGLMFPPKAFVRLIVPRLVITGVP